MYSVYIHIYTTLQVVYETYIYTTLRNDRFSPSFLSETPPDPPRLLSIPWEVPKRASLKLQNYAAVEKRVESQVLAIFMYRMRHVFPSLVPVSSLCQRRLAYILYESWLLVYSAYLQPGNRGQRKFAAHMPPSRRAYILYTA